MVFGFLRRRRGGSKGGTPRFHPQQGNPPVPPSTPITEPIGEDLDDGYIPDPRELAAAEPIPPMGDWWNPEDVGLSWDEAGWPLVYKDVWRPKRVRSHGRFFRDPLWLPGFKMGFIGMVWANGKIYLVDGASLAILYEADGTKTASEIVERIVHGYVQHLPENDSLRIAFSRANPSEEEKKEMYGFISALYFQMALLKKKGLLI